MDGPSIPPQNINLPAVVVCWLIPAATEIYAQMFSVDAGNSMVSPSLSLPVPAFLLSPIVSRASGRRHPKLPDRQNQLSSGDTSP